MAEIGSVLDGKYKILDELGHGGMSVVYLAMDAHLNKQWAIKEIRKKGVGENGQLIVNSLLAEADLMKRLDHPSCPRIVDIIDNGETIFVVMDYIEGSSLDKVLAEYGAQPEKTVIGWAKQLCDVLSYLHSQKPPIIYRDMKPANVMLRPEGNIKIIDFGIAREYKEQSLSDTTVLGTKGYAPPEQYNGQTDARSDIYALGMTMHQLLTGINPMQKKYAPVRMWNPDISEGMEMIIDKCVQPAAENRYQNCRDLLYDLEHPELITKGYKKKQKRKLRGFVALVVMTMIFLISGVVCNRVSKGINDRDYDKLIGITEASSLDKKISNYKKAIEIYPEKTEAYDKMLDAYKDEDMFNEKNSEVFLAIYNKYRKELEESNESTAERAELNYKIGEMYFTSYEDDNGEHEYSTRIQKAYAFFKKNKDIKFENKDMSECYLKICEFYKDYILSETSDEPNEKAYDDLIKEIAKIMENLENKDPYVQIAFYNSVFMLLNDQREYMAQVGVEQNTIDDMLDEIKGKSEGLELIKETNIKLRDEILNNYDNCKAAIATAYKNTEQRRTSNEKTTTDE